MALERDAGLVGPLRVWLDATKLGGHAKVLVHDVCAATRAELMVVLEEHATAVKRDRHTMAWIVEYHDPDFDEWFELDETLRGLRNLSRPCARLRVAFVPRRITYTRDEAGRKIQRWLRFALRKGDGIDKQAVSTFESSLARDVRRAINLCQQMNFDQTRNTSSQPCYNANSKELEFPAYVAVVIKQIRNLCELMQTIDIAFTLVLRIEFGDRTPARLREHLVERLQLRINETPCTLDPSTTDCKWRGSMFFATTRMRLESTSFVNSTLSEDYSIWSPFPFDQPLLNFAFELTSCTIAPESREDVESPVSCLRGWKARYNVHKYLGRPDENAHKHATLLRNRAHISFKPSADAMPNFDILHSAVSVDFPAERKKEKDGTMRLHYPCISFEVPLFRHPGSIIRLMVFPLLVLNTGTLLTMFMDDYGQNYNDRIMTLVTLILSLFAFLSYVRNTLPDVPVMTWMDKIIFKSTIMNLSVMIESVFAFLTSNPGSVNANIRGGAFSFFWVQRTTGRALVRCFGVGSIVIGLQLSIIISLLLNWYRYDDLRSANNRVIAECQSEVKKSAADFKRGLYGLDASEMPRRRRSLIKKEDANGRNMLRWFETRQDSDLLRQDVEQAAKRPTVLTKLRSIVNFLTLISIPRRKTSVTKVDIDRLESMGFTP